MPPSTESKKYIEDFISSISQYDRYEKNSYVIATAIKFAQKAHDGQIRKMTGEPFISHPLAVAQRVANKTNDPESVIAAILHDAAEDSPMISLESIYDTFGQTVGMLVDSVTDTSPFFLRDKTIHCSDKIEKILAGGLRNISSLIIKIADREHNLSTIDGLDQSKQIRMSFESQAIYIPLKSILGYDELDFSRESAQKSLDAYCEKNNIKTQTDLKKSLMNQMYLDFDNETFIYTYSHSPRVMRNIEEKALFYEMVEELNFANAIDIIRMEQSGDSFMVEFLFTKGALTKDEANLDMGGYTTS